MVSYIYTLPEFDFVGGASLDLIFHTYVEREKLKPFGLLGCTANFALINFVNRTGEPVLSKSMDIRINGEGTAYNVLHVELLPNETLDLHGKYIYQITIRDIDGKSDDPKQGVINIHGNINKGFLRT